MLRFGNFSPKIELGERKRNKNYKHHKNYVTLKRQVKYNLTLRFWLKCPSIHNN